MLRNQLPADELAHIRDEIRALRAREVQLRKCFTEECDNGFYEGCDFDVEVRMQKQCVLNKNRLPAEILDDPQYFDIRYTPVVRVKPRIEPRLPLDYGQIGAAQNENFDVIETWT